MKRNILTENMRRFGTKNLLIESDASRFWNWEKGVTSLRNQIAQKVKENNDAYAKDPDSVARDLDGDRINEIIDGVASKIPELYEKHRSSFSMPWPRDIQARAPLQDTQDQAFIDWLTDLAKAILGELTYWERSKIFAAKAISEDKDWNGLAYWIKDGVEKLIYAAAKVWEEPEHEDGEVSRFELAMLSVTDASTFVNLIKNIYNNL